MFQGNASYKITSKNNQTKEGYFQLNYDGDNATLAEIENNKITITQLNSDDINDLLTMPKHTMSLMERLQRDYLGKHNPSHKHKKPRTMRLHNK